MSHFHVFSRHCKDDILDTDIVLKEISWEINTNKHKCKSQCFLHNIYQSVDHQPFTKMFATRMLFTNSDGQKYNEIRKQIVRMLSVIVDIVCLQISTILVFVFPKLICCFTSACKIFFHEQTIYDNFFIYRFRNIQKN